MPDGRPIGCRDAPLGGQAVLEGVMMRGVSTWAVAMRTPDGTIETHAEPVVSAAARRRVLRLPVIRGVVALVESLRIGFRAMRVATNAQITPEDDIEEVGGWLWALTVAGALLIAVTLFFLVPVGLTSLFKDELGSPVVFWLVEGTLRTVIFIAYIVVVSRLAQLRRVFQYHGAEHKTISAWEAGDALVPERVAVYSRMHPRCGTSFLLLVIVLAVFVLAPIGLPEWYWLMISMVLGIPLIAGLAYEVIKWAGRNRRRAWVRALMWPGLMLQDLTTRDPEPEQMEVAIAALEQVLAVEGPQLERGLERGPELEIVA